MSQGTCWRGGAGGGGGQGGEGGDLKPAGRSAASDAVWWPAAGQADTPPRKAITPTAGQTRACSPAGPARTTQQREEQDGNGAARPSAHDGFQAVARQQVHRPAPCRHQRLATDGCHDDCRPRGRGRPERLGHAGLKEARGLAAGSAALAGLFRGCMCKLRDACAREGARGQCMQGGSC